MAAINLSLLANAKKLPIRFLRQLGLENGPNGDGVEIPYFAADGAGIAVKRRVALAAKDGTYWPRNTPLACYGLWKLTEARGSKILFLVEGESDCWTLWFHERPALGLPGAGTANTLEKEMLHGLEILYVHVERDAGGKLFHDGVLRRLSELGYTGEVRVLQMPDGIHDPSALHLDDETRFVERLDLCMKASRPACPTHLHPLRAAARPAPIETQPGKQAAPAPDEAIQVNLASVPAEQVQWLWPGRIPLGKLTILDGDPGLGKSSVLLDLAARLTCGLPMPFVPPEQAWPASRVVLLTTEDGLGDTIRPRLDAAGAVVERIIALRGIGRPTDETVFPFSLPMHTQYLEEVLKQTDAKLVVIDPLMAFLDESVQAHNDQSVRRALMPLAQMAERRGAAIVVIRHLNKQMGKNALYRGGGSIGIIGAVRSGLMVCKDPDDANRRLLAVTKSNLCKPACTLRFELIGSDNATRVSWLGDCAVDIADVLAEQEAPAEPGAHDEAEAFLTERMRTEPRVPAALLTREAVELGIKEKTLKRAKLRLKIDSKFIPEPNGHGGSWMWVWPEQDAKAA